MSSAAPSVVSEKWLLLMHQLPAKPAYARVKIWRRLQALGAVTVKNAVYALPASEQSQEDFAWLLKEIRQAGGEAMVCEARLIAGLSDSEVRGLFTAARETEYMEIAKEARAVSATLKTAAKAQSVSNLKVPISRLRARHTQITTVDFFGANGRDTADALIKTLENALAGALEKGGSQELSPRFAPQDLKNRVWVTRQGVHVDRIACAWLIRRFIDSEAVFKFVRAKGYEQTANELRFDMFEAEFTHEGDRCSFEVLLGHSGLQEPALQAIAEIVHDIDLKDEKFGRNEAVGIKTLLNGICMDTDVDEERLARGAALFDDLFSIFRKTRSSKSTLRG